MLETEVIRTLPASPSDAGPRMTRTPEALKSGPVTLGIFFANNSFVYQTHNIYEYNKDSERFVSIRYTLYTHRYFISFFQSIKPTLTYISI